MVPFCWNCCGVRQGERRAAMMFVFVIDDDADFVDIVVRVLAHPQRTVRGFTDPLRALSELTVTPPAVCVVDLWMPNLDGEAFVRAAQLRAPTAEFLLITGTDKTTAFAAGARVGAAVLRKPFDIDDIRRAVSNLTRKGSP